MRIMAGRAQTFEGVYLAWQFEQEMGRQRKTKQARVKGLKTSRSQLDRATT